MGITLIIIGIGCMIAALIGGGVKLVQLEIAKFTSGRRQAALGVLGLVIFAIGLAIDQQPKLASSGGDQANATGPAPAPIMANQPAAQPADAKPSEPPAPVQSPTPSPAANLNGWWRNQDGGTHEFTQTGNSLFVTAHINLGTFNGTGAIEGRQVSWGMGDAICRGQLTDPDTITSNCVSPTFGPFFLRLARIDM